MDLRAVDVVQAGVGRRAQRLHAAEDRRRPAHADRASAARTDQRSGADGSSAAAYIPRQGCGSAAGPPRGSQRGRARAVPWTRRPAPVGVLTLLPTAWSSMRIERSQRAAGTCAAVGPLAGNVWGGED